MCSFGFIIRWLRNLDISSAEGENSQAKEMAAAAAAITATEKEYRAWASDKEKVLLDLGVELEEATETHLQLVVNGGKLQILIPSAYYHVDGDSSEIFLVLTMGDAEGKVEAAMMVLNEKLDKIRVKPKALLQVLDLLFAALKKLNLQHGSKRRKCHNEDHMDVEMPSDWEGEDDEEEEDEDEDEACNNSEEEYESDPGDMAGYDIAVGDQGTSCSMAEIRERGCLHALAESARKVCEDYQRGASRDLQSPYMWFRVVSKPMLLTVQIQLEVAGMIDDRIAAGLGLTFKEPVLLNLEFSKNLWAETSFRKEKFFRYERVTASQNPLPSSVETEQTLDEIDRFLETSSGDKHRSYGLDVLFPELTARFFAHLNQEASGESVHLDGFEYVKLDSKNPFICLAHYISNQLKLLPAWCLVCWKKLPSAVTRMRTCDDDLCLYRFEELGLGVSVLDEVQNNPELVEMELSLAFSAVESSRDVFEPFPGFLLVENQIRGRSGWFSNKATERGQKNDSREDAGGHPVVPRAAPQTGRANKMCVVLKEVISSIPGVQTLGRCTSEQALKKALTRAWFLYKQKQKRAFNEPPPSLPPSWASDEEAEKWKRDSQLPYNVARFILMTNRLSLSLLSPADQIIKLEKRQSAPGVFEDKGDPEWTIYQFVVLHDTPEREAYFSLQRELYGSYFAFHGSGAENWYSILRNGLRSMSNTNYMSTGAAYGEGIYLASHLDTSMGYARSVGCSWPGGKLMNGYQCLAICEVINNSHRPPSSQRSSSPTILVVPRENERNVAIRYFMVFKPNATKALVYKAGTYPFEIQGLNLLGDPKINLLEHYRRLRNSHKEALDLQNRTRMKERSEIFLAALPQPPPPPPPPTSSTKVTKPVKRVVEPTMTTRASSAGSRAVMQELNNLTKAIKKSPPIATCIEKGEPAAVLSGTTVTLPDEEGNLSLWRIEIHPYLLRESKNLYNDFLELKRLLNRQEDVPVVLEVKFPATFPFAPPFVRVLSPRFRSQTGHVTVGGSICMELLTASGWSPACNFESMLVQVVMAFVEGDGRLDLKVSVHGREYQEGEAREAFLRAANTHGWKTS